MSDKQLCENWNHRNEQGLATVHSINKYLSQIIRSQAINHTTLNEDKRDQHSVGNHYNYH